MFKDKTTRKQRMQKSKKLSSLAGMFDFKNLPKSYFEEDKEINIAYALLITITVIVLLAQILHWTPLQINL